MIKLKDIKDQLDMLKSNIDIIHRNIATLESSARSIKYNPYEEYYKNALKTIEMQNKTIENLSNLLCNKYEHGFFVMSNDGEMPIVIKDGKIITGNKVSSFSVDWSHGEAIALSVDYME